MENIFANWRTQQSWYSLQGELKEWLVSESYFTVEDIKLIEEGAISDISSFVKRKLTAAKAWTYEKYVSYVKPLLNKLIGFIKKLKEKGILKKYRARFEIQAIKLFSTKKYIKLGAVFLTAMIKVMTSGLLELPQILEKIQKVLGLIQDGAWATAADEIGLPFEEIKALVGGLKGFGKDLKKTQDIFSPEKIGQGDLELAETLDPEDIIADKYSYNSAKTSQHRWSPGRPIVDYHDTVEGRVYTITFPDGTNKADFWPTEESKPGEDLDAFLSRTKDPVQLNLALDPEIIKTIEESAQNVLELPINNMYMDGKHITVQLNTDSREHAPEFTRLVQNRWAHSAECLKLEKMGYKVYINTKDREIPGISLTKNLMEGLSDAYGPAAKQLVMDLYNKFWKQTAKHEEDFELYDPKSSNQEAMSNVAYALSHIKSLLSKNQEPKPEEIVAAIEDGWEESSYEFQYAMDPDY